MEDTVTETITAEAVEAASTMLIPSQRTSTSRQVRVHRLLMLWHNKAMRLHHLLDGLHQAATITTAHTTRDIITILTIRATKGKAIKAMDVIRTKARVTMVAAKDAGTTTLMAMATDIEEVVGVEV